MDFPWRGTLGSGYIPAYPLIFESLNISWGSAFRSSKHQSSPGMTGVHFGGLGFIRASSRSHHPPPTPWGGLKLGDESVRSRTGAEMDGNFACWKGKSLSQVIQSALFGMKNVTPLNGCWWPTQRLGLKLGHGLNHLVWVMVSNTGISSSMSPTGEFRYAKGVVVQNIWCIPWKSKTIKRIVPLNCWL